jgi:hypothetical protein
MRMLLAEQRRRGETDGWTTTIVLGGGAADERGPSCSGRGRGGALTGGTGLSAGVDGGEAAACAGRACPAREGKRWAEPR